MSAKDNDSFRQVSTKQGHYAGFGGGAAESAAAIREAYGTSVPPINVKRGSESKKNQKS